MFETEIKIGDHYFEVDYEFDDSVPSVTIEWVFIDRTVNGKLAKIDITSEAMSLKDDWTAEEELICDEHIENWAEFYVNKQNKCL